MSRLPVAIARFLFVMVIGAVATVLGTLLALGFTSPGRSLLAEVVTARSAALVRGSLSVGRIEGNFYNWLRLDSVVVRDTTGFPLASLGRVELRFLLANLLAGRIVFDKVTLIRPRIHLVHHRNGRLNFEEVLRIGEGPPGQPGPGKLVDFNDVTIEDGILTVLTPWSPPGHLRGQQAADSALAAARLVAARRIEEGGPGEGLQQYRTVEGLNAHFTRARISTPDREPILLQVDSLSFLVSDPLLDVRHLSGEIRQQNDTLWFDLRRAELPGTRGTARGLVSWPTDTLLFDFNFNAGRVALADLRFVSPDFPDYTGRGRMTAVSVGTNVTEFRIPDLDVGDGTARIRGKLTAVTHRFRGLGFRGLDLDLTEVDLDAVRPYLDTLPLTGRLSGRLRADGYFDQMEMAADWQFYDYRVPGNPVNLIQMRGPVTMGGDEGFIFHNVTLDSADLDLPTIRLAVPAVILEGRARGAGTLDGPWKDVTFTGHLLQVDEQRPVSATEGRIRINTRDTIVAMDADLEFKPLDFEGVRRSFPTLTTLGSVRGPVHLEGPLDRMFVRADLTGELGQIRAEGIMTMLPPRWGADSLRLDFTDLDVSQVRGTGPPTRLTGRALVSGAADSAVAPDGDLVITLAPGWIREIGFDTVTARLRVRDSVIEIDTSVVGFTGFTVTASGTLGWARPRDGTLTITARGDQLSAFDSLVTAAINPAPDTTMTREILAGTVEATVTLKGALDSMEIRGNATATGLHWNGYHVPNAKAEVDWGGGPRSQVDFELTADSVTKGRYDVHDLQATARGLADSLRWRVSAASGGSVSLATSGEFWSTAGRTVLVDTLDLGLRGNGWSSEAPFRVTLEDSTWSFSETAITRRDGSARISMSGNVPSRREGEFDVRVSGLDMRDIYAVMLRDTSRVGGTIFLDTRIAGTSADPVFRGTSTLTGPVFGDFRAPLMRAAFNYRRKRLDSNLSFWRTGSSLMDVNAVLPLDLAWSRDTRGTRQMPGDLAIRIEADSMNLAVFEAFTRNIRQIRGTLKSDVTVQGTWDAPRLGGTVEIQNGRALLPSLGVRYGPMNGRVTLAGDSIVVDTLQIGGESGELLANGLVRLENLTRPVLDLSLRARNFKVMDVPEFLDLEADGTVQLRGPVLKATLTGQATARNSVIYFADLVSKSIVNLEDPLYADLVDTAAIRARGLGAALQNRFLDSLTIRNFGFTAAEGVWLRSNEANIQLQGGVTVQKNRNLYRFDGVFNAIRGTYNLKLLAITRAFDVTRGQVTYLGDPDLNADLDIDARHIIRPADAEATARDVEVTAHIGGTLREPKLALASSIRPPLSQSDIISLLVLRRTVNSSVVSSSQEQQVTQLASLLASTLASEIENRLVGDPGAGPTSVEIRPGENLGGQAGRYSLTRLSAGWQLGSKWFVSLNTGFCPDFQQFDFRNFGASLDYRLNASTTASVSAEPVQTCVSGASVSTSKRYQIGGDIKWSREY
jgi:autotransporter translocation and assembly factor TamB